MILQEPSAGSTEIGGYESSSAFETAQVRAAFTVNRPHRRKEEGRKGRSTVLRRRFEAARAARSVAGAPACGRRASSS
jgi:hypothetical protein